MLNTSRIKKITPLGTRVVADITVAKDHSYIGNGIVSHNSKAPNLQNIPKHVKVDNPDVEEVVGMIMRSFTVPRGYTLMALDFSQAELRIIAELANETTMIDAYNRGIDLHALTAALLSGRTIEEFYKLDKKEQSKLRSKAKAANFGLIYGQEALGFMEYAEANYGVKMTLEEATTIRTNFFKTYPRLLEYHEEYIAKARQFGYVRTMLGRKRHALNINNTDDFIRGQDEREVINHPVQGSCGEMTILTFGLLYYRLPSTVKFANTVHDSILYYVPNHLVKYVARVAKHTAENLPTKFLFGRELEKLKLVADVEVANSMAVIGQTSWKELKPYTEEDWDEYQASDDSSYYSFSNRKEQESKNKILV